MRCTHPVISPFYKIAVWLLTLVVVFVSGLFALHRMTRFPLEVSWNSDTLHIYSAKEGPWVVTHLVHMRPNSRFYDSVAQLPVPATIIDSRGENFPLPVIQSLSWVDHSGAHVEAPKAGEPMSAFYYVPEQALYHDFTK